MLDTHISLRAVRSYKLRVGAKDRLSNSGNRNEGATTTGCCEHAGRIRVGSNLLKRLHTILLDCAVEKGQRQPIIQKTKTGAHNPLFRRAPSQAEPRTEVVRVSAEW